MQSRSLLRTFIVVPALAIASAAVCSAQEVGSIDLTDPSAQAELRRPAHKHGETAVSGISETHDCNHDEKGTAALKIILVSLDRNVYTVDDEPRFQVRIENVGSKAIKLPFSRYIAELQPADPAQKFAYYRMVLELWVGGKYWESNTGGEVTLYGDDVHTGTMLTLQPGQSVKIIGKGRVRLPEDFNSLIASGDTLSRANARTLIYQDETLLTGNAT